MKLIFLFSLPRSGSTLLQHLLSGHPEIATVSEPWLLLPLCYALKQNGTFSEYNHGWANNALNDFISKLPDQKENYYRAIRNFSIALYTEASQRRTKYFLEKTPRYYLIIPQITKIFPDAKFIFLFRNPIQILASVVQSSNRGRMLLHQHTIDLYRGPRLLAQGYQQTRDTSLAIHFDRIVGDTENELRKIFAYLELDLNVSVLTTFQDFRLGGRMGDKDGYYKYDQVVPQVVDKWKTVLATEVRKKFIKHYLEKLDNNTLKTFGCNRQKLKKSIDEIRPEKSGYLSDGFDLLLTTFYRFFEATLFVKKFRYRNKLGGPHIMHR